MGRPRLGNRLRYLSPTALTSIAMYTISRDLIVEFRKRKAPSSFIHELPHKLALRDFLNILRILSGPGYNRNYNLTVKYFVALAQLLRYITRRMRSYLLQPPAMRTRKSNPKYKQSLYTHIKWTNTIYIFSFKCICLN